MKAKTAILLPTFMLLFSLSGHAEISSSNYSITSTVMSGGGGSMGSANFKLSSTLGQPSPIGNSSSGSFIINGGFWHTLLLDIVGDVNGDGIIDLEDVITALQVITGQSMDAARKQADVDGDGVIGLSESIMILRTLSGM